MKINHYVKSIGITIILIFGANLLMKELRQMDYLRGTSFVCETSIGKLYLSDEFELSGNRLNTLKNYINESVAAVNSTLNIPKEEIKIVVKRGDGYGLTYIESRIIELGLNEYCFSPFIHEYFHVIFKDFEEFWFMEGLPTYLSEYVRYQNQQLDKYCDSNNAWFKEGSPKNSKDIVPVDDVIIKYSKAELIGLLMTKEFDELDENNVIDYYRLSANLIEAIVKEIGIDRLTAIAGSRSLFDRSIEDEFQEEGIIIENFMNNWIDQLYE